MSSNEQLRPGRHQLSRDEVRSHQRDRIFGALETVMSAQGYVDTSVADVIRTAGVSRQTFYEIFTSKQDCFLAGYAHRQDSLLDYIFQTSASEAPMERFAALLQTYLGVMASNPALARLFLVGVYAAGAEAVALRLKQQQKFVDGIVEVFDARSEQDLFACKALVAAISTLVTHALLDVEPRAVLDLHQPLVLMARQLMTPR